MSPLTPDDGNLELSYNTCHKYNDNSEGIKSYKRSHIEQRQCKDAGTNSPIAITGERGDWAYLVTICRQNLIPGKISSPVRPRAYHVVPMLRVLIPGF